VIAEGDWLEREMALWMHTVQGLRPIERSQLLHNPGGARVRDVREFGAEMGRSGGRNGAGGSRARMTVRERELQPLVLTRCQHWP